MTEEGVIKSSRILREETCRKFEFKEMIFTTPTAMSISDEGLFLVGFMNGSIGLYSQHYTIPLTIWQNTCEGKIVIIKWSSVYFEDITKEHMNYQEKEKGASNSAIDFHSMYKNNLSVFYVIDSQNIFYAWNLNKSVNKAIITVDLGKISNNTIQPNSNFDISY